MSERQFPILRDGRAPAGACDSVPWSWVAPHEAQAKRNHDQTLERLAERGGLSPGELHCAVHGTSLRSLFRRELTGEQAEAWLASWDGSAPTRAQ